MNPAIIVLLVVGLIAAWWLFRNFRRTRSGTTEPETPPRARTSAFHAVSIRASENACSAARALAGRRFLAAETPDLPLPECDAPQCNCRFLHHDDRRSGSDRRNPYAPSTYTGATGRHEIDRRSGQDRRMHVAD